MGKQYRTARGKVVDLDELMMKNNQSIAVGNYRVNAQGDELGPDGQIVRTKNEVASNYYNKNPKAVQHKKQPTLQNTIEEDVVIVNEEPEPVKPKRTRSKKVQSKTENIEMETGDKDVHI